MLRFADHAIAVTDQLKERYVERGARPDRITVVLNGADPESVLGDWKPPAEEADDGRFTVICHGSIEDRYGQDTIVEAARILKPRAARSARRHPRPREGGRALVQQIEALGVGDIVSFEGWVSDERLTGAAPLRGRRDRRPEGDAVLAPRLTNKMVDYWIFGLP